MAFVWHYQHDSFPRLLVHAHFNQCHILNVDLVEDI